MSNLEVYKKPESLAKYEKPGDFIRMVPMVANRELRHIKTEYDILVSVSNRETASIAKLKKEHGEDKTIAFITIWLTDLNVSLNVKSPMGSGQIEECAFFILDDYYYLTLADFKLFFTGVKKGKYGKAYESLSAAKIIGWLEQYVIDRTTLFENATEEEQTQLRSREATGKMGSIKELTEKLEIRKSLGK